MSLQHHNLIAWQRADDLYISLHALTRYINPDMFGALDLQVRKAGAPLLGLIRAELTWLRSN